MRLLALLLLSCGSGFSAPCGIKGENLDAWELSRETVRAVDALGGVDGWSPEGVCASLDGYRVEGHPGASWAEPMGEVAGLTDCESRTIQVGTGGPLRASALAHEFAHAVEGCTEASNAHRGWRGIGGVYAAVAVFNDEANL